MAGGCGCQATGAAHQCDQRLPQAGCTGYSTSSRGRAVLTTGVRWTRSSDVTSQCMPYHLLNADGACLLLYQVVSAEITKPPCCRQGHHCGRRLEDSQWWSRLAQSGAASPLQVLRSGAPWHVLVPARVACDHSSIYGEHNCHLRRCCHSRRLLRPHRSVQRRCRVLLATQNGRQPAARQPDALCAVAPIWRTHCAADISGADGALPDYCVYSKHSLCNVWPRGRQTRYVPSTWRANRAPDFIASGVTPALAVKAALHVSSMYDAISSTK